MMTGYSTPKMSVKDSFDDDEVSDDIEDEVFIRDGRKGFKRDEEMGVKRPLMAPRRKLKNSLFYHEGGKHNYYRRNCAPYCYGLAAIAIILGSLIGASLFVNFFPSPLLYKLRIWPVKNQTPDNIVPCIDYTTETVWRASFDKLKSDAALVMVDLNNDSVNDVVVGFATSFQLPSSTITCEEWPDSKGSCGGGALALDGKTGKLLWRFWTRQDILFVDCSSNLNSDPTKDCLISGKGGVLCTIDGKTGKLIWELTKSEFPNLIDIYSAQFIGDLDGDGYNELLIAHTSDQTGHLLVLSGRVGELIGQFRAPNKEGLFTAPRVVITKDGSYFVLFATGAFDSPGSIYTIPLASLAKNLPMDSEVRPIWHGPLSVSSGFVLADMTGDGFDDIVVTAGSTLMVLNGDNFTMQWNVSSYPSAEPDQNLQIAVGPTPAYFDDDNIPDLLVSHFVGSSFPNYLYSKTWVASGKTGEPLLGNSLLGGSEVTAPGISISFSGNGNDMFLFWQSTCNVSPDQMKLPFTFQKGSSMSEKAHSNLCKLRFNTTLELQLLALNQHIEPPGFQLYSTKTFWNSEHNNTNGSDPKDIKPTLLEWSEGGSEPFNQVTIKRPSFLPFPHKGKNQNMEQFPQYPEIPIEERHRSDWYPINVNFGESSLDYNNQDLSEEAKMRIAADGRNERRTVRNVVDDYSYLLPWASSTATLAAPLSHEGIDVLFATYWEMPSGNVRVVTEQEALCIKEKMDKMAADTRYYNIELARENSARDCRRQEATEDSDDGQLTVYRFNFKCQCSHLRSGEKCSVPLPINRQSFSHRAGDVYFKSRH